jgi:putative nucleotidyltransferase with HDIG domain
LAERITKGALELPVLPEAASKVVQLCNDPKTDLRQIAEAVNRDPAMAGNLMRLANSTMYGGANPLVSLDQVLARLGTARVREMALIIACQGKVFVVPGYERLVKFQFRHCLAAAVYAQEIARGRRWNVEEAFLCGLLHDIGRPVLLQEVLETCAACHVPFDLDAADGAIAVLHARVGAEMVKQWKLPVRLSEVVEYHHDPLRAPTARNQAMMTALADDLAHLIMLGPKQVAHETLLEHPLLPELNIYPDELEALIALAPKVVATVQALG